MSILVINSGSTSIKYKLFSDDVSEISQGNLENVVDRSKALKQILREIGGLADLRAVGHRVVHGGEKFTGPVVVSNEILSQIEEFNHLAPLHNPFNLAAIRTVGEYLPTVPQVAVFDTSFYSVLPKTARSYALPQALSEKYSIKRFGFHGTSHKYVMLEAAKILKKPVNKINLITCHLGGGWSTTAIQAGKPIDTSMGWTPLEGLIMMTRSGDLDPSIVLELVKNSQGETAEQKCEQVYNFLNHEAGIKGLSGAVDYKQFLRQVSLGDENSRLAFEMVTYRLTKYIGSYFAALGGKVDAVVFTGAVGSGDPATRNRVIDNLKFLKRTKFLSIHTDEELMIAGEVGELLNI